MKKTIAILLISALLTGCLSACGAASAAGVADQSGLQIVTTIFPEYDWVNNILGENPANAEVTMLLDNGVDLHSYQPTAADILNISTCDLFVYVGGESDAWVEDALKEATNKDMVVVDLLDVLGDSVKEEEVVEGMQADEDEHHHDGDEEEHEHHHDEDADEHAHDDAEEAHEHEHHHDEEEPEYDEHVWLSLRNAAVLTDRLSQEIQKIDPDHAQTYQDNTAAYLDKLNKLDDQYREAVSQGSVNTLLFGDRFPFRYLVDDYNLSYYAAFVGCSAETEASFETITFLAGKLDELSLPAILTIEGPDHRIAETIVQAAANKDLPILTMDSMQSTTSKDVENGTTYLSVMESNLSVLTEALK